MMACAPSSLRRTDRPEEEKVSSAVTLPTLTTQDLQMPDVVIPELPDSLPFVLNDSLGAVAEVPADSTAAKDTVVISKKSLLTTIDNLKEAAAKTKRDTTTMDSLELAIYKHNIVFIQASLTNSIVKIIPHIQRQKTDAHTRKT